MLGQEHHEQREQLRDLVGEAHRLQADDPAFGADLNLDRRKVPAGSVLQGASLLATSNRNWNVYGQKTLLTGGNIRLDWLNNRFTTDSDFQSLSPQYTPQALLSLNQPLLRGFGLYFSRLNIRIAETATDAAIETYRANVANFITQVVTAYWNVVRLTEQLGVLQSSLELAQQTVRDNRVRVDVGVLPPVAIKESEAEAARREEEVIVATNALNQARRTLRQIVFVPAGQANAFPRPVDPIDRPMIERFLKLKFKNVALDFDPLAQSSKLEGYSYAEIERVCVQAIKSAVIHRRKTVREQDLRRAIADEVRRRSGRARLKASD